MNVGWRSVIGSGRFLPPQSRVDPCESAGGGMCGVHGDLDPADRDGDPGTDLEESEPARSRSGAGHPAAVKRLTECGEEDRREGGEEEAELVGGEAGGRGPVREEIQLLLLDRVLHVAPRAVVEALVDGPGPERCPRAAR